MNHKFILILFTWYEDALQWVIDTVKKPSVDMQQIQRQHLKRFCGQSGQATTEYALILLGVAALALLLVAWATRTDRIGQLFDEVFNQIMSKGSQ